MAMRDETGGRAPTREGGAATQTPSTAPCVPDVFDTPYGPFRIAWGASGAAADFPAPNDIREAADLEAMRDEDGPISFEIRDPRHGNARRFDLYRDRRHPERLHVMSELSDGVWAQGTEAGAK